MKQRELERTDVVPAEARLIVIREMGNVTRERERSRAIWIASWLENWLYGVGRFDLRAYAGVAVILALAAVVATYVPVRRATRVDPTTALRSE